MRSIVLIATLSLALPGCDAAVPLPDGADAPPSRLAQAAHRERAGTETEGRPHWEHRSRLQDGSSLVQDATGLQRDGAPLADEPASEVVVSEHGDRFAYIERVDGGPQTRLVACTLERCVIRVRAGHPDRLAMSPDGARLAFVASRDGLPAVHVLPFASGPPIAVTNTELDRSAPGRPIGFVPPPHDAPLAFDGDALAWTSEEGEHRVVLP